ncbi:D-alanyl-D-alanine carboxypeptidase dacC precursor [Raoultella terrigena]|uniref:D-alanyl-D-alanine carboxypeptidase dacC n=1 Tax=Raoultella terrigena TaxID=577 RepID=A0A3P8L0G3_RAOTE|nr:D-alanyl-D-alanine carboxypeptidase dacC precursor [Raoultella terrigena]
MALLTKAMIHDVPEEYAIHKEKSSPSIRFASRTRNRLLWSTNLNADGVKTGTTTGAGYNLVSSAHAGRYAPDCRGAGDQNRPYSL